MNNIEKITDRIKADAQEQIKIINEKSDAECADIRAKAEKDAKKLYDSLVQDGIDESQICKERQASLDALSEKKKILTCKQEMVDKAFELYSEELNNLPDEEYKELLVKLIVSNSFSGAEEVILSEKDKAKFGKSVIKEANAFISSKGGQGGLKLSDKTGRFSGGAILCNGRIEQNCTFEEVIASVRRTKSGEIAKALFAK